MTGTVKTAVVGVGALGQHHLKWLAQLPASELVGFYDVDEQKRAHFAQEYNVIAFSSLEELANHVEAVSIAVPTSSHFEVASYLISRGRHCLIEKPLTATCEEAQRLAALAENKNVCVTVGQIERFNPAVRALASDDVRPSFIEAHRLASFDPRGTDVAVVLDLMIHDIDLVLMLVKSPVIDIQASAVAVVSERFDIANARLTFTSGAVANLTASRISLHPMRKLRIFQKSGYYSLDLARKQADLYTLAVTDEKTDGMRIPLGKSGRDVVYRKRSDDGSDMLAAELQAFLDAVAGNAEVAVSLEDAVEALRVALEVERIGNETISRLSETTSV